MSSPHEIAMGMPPVSRKKRSIAREELCIDKYMAAHENAQKALNNTTIFLRKGYSVEFLIAAHPDN
jgi:hypothetical protein